MSATEAVAQYLPDARASGRSSRTVLGDIRRRCRLDDLARLIAHPASERDNRARAVMDAIEMLRGMAVPRRW